MASQRSDDLNTRRRAMRAELIGAMTRRHRRRRMVPRAAAIIGLAALAGLLVVAVDGPRGSERLAVNQFEAGPSPIEEATTDRPAAIITEVRTDPDIVDRYAATGTGLAQVVSDAELLAALSEINRPTGLIREAGAVRFTDEVLDSLDEETPRDG